MSAVPQSRSSGEARCVVRAGAALLAAAYGLAHGQCVPEWSFPGGNTSVDGVVHGLSTAGGNPGSPNPAYLVVGGGSDNPSTILFDKIALWDGWAWRRLPSAPWPGAAEDVEGVPGDVFSFFATGNFELAGGVPVQNIAEWSVGHWSEPGGGLGPSSGLALFWCPGPAPLGPALYAGGQFDYAGGAPIRGLARWDGGAWTAVGGGIANPNLADPMALAFALYDDDGPGPRPVALYVGGPFDYAGGLLVNHVGRWDGIAWESVGGGTGADVQAMAVFDHDGPGPARDSLFVGGGYNYAGGVFVDGLGRWDGASWHAVPGWTGSSPSALAVFDDDGAGPRKPALFVAGISVHAAGLPISKIARWDGEQWDALNGGITGAPFGTPQVYALEVFDEDGPGPNPGGLYAGGWFNFAGGIPAPRIARWGCPLPARCDANCNRDFHPVTGLPILTVADFGCFQTRYMLKDPYGDCNADGDFTVQDFGCFQTLFVAGCP